MRDFDPEESEQKSNAKKEKANIPTCTRKRPKRVDFTAKFGDAAMDGHRWPAHRDIRCDSVFGNRPQHRGLPCGSRGIYTCECFGFNYSASQSSTFSNRGIVLAKL